MPAHLLAPILLAAALLAPPAAAVAQEDTPLEAQPDVAAPLEGAVAQDDVPTLRVATRSAPPFAMLGPDGAWTGIAIEMFRTLADELDLRFELHDTALTEMVEGTAEGRFDAAVAALTITPERETRVDFTFPFYSTGLGIAVDASDRAGWFRVLRNVFTWQFLAVVAGLSAVLLAAGAAVWFFERRGNTEEFQASPVKGLGDGFWWAAVTMTTVGYGDKSPRTLGGRIIGLIWMFAAMIIVASFTAAIAASLTVGSLSDRVQGIADLDDVRVGAVADAAAGSELAQRGIAARTFAGVEAGFDALLNGEIDAFVHDRPLLQWIGARDYQGEIRVLDEPIGRQDYGIALPPGDALREPMNRALLAYTRSADWSRLTRQYLGE